MRKRSFFAFGAKIRTCLATLTELKDASCVPSRTANYACALIAFLKTSHLRHLLVVHFTRCECFAVGLATEILAKNTSFSILRRRHTSLFLHLRMITILCRLILTRIKQRWAAFKSWRFLKRVWLSRYASCKILRRKSSALWAKYRTVGFYRSLIALVLSKKVVKLEVSHVLVHNLWSSASYKLV